MSKFKQALVATAIVGAATGSYYGGKTVESRLSATEKIEESLDGKKRYVTYSRSSFLSKQGQFQVQSALSTSSGIQVKDQLKGINGFTFNATQEEINKALSGVSAFSNDWIITEDRKYTIDFITGCARNPDPPDTDQTPIDPVVPWGVEKTQALEAAALVDESEIIVCITDTGTDFDHPDLKPMLIGGSTHVQGSSSWRDNQGHGTHVAGTVSAQLNDRDVVGVAQVKIFTAKVLDGNGSGYGSWIAEGIVSCVNNGAHIISMSLGSPASAGPDPLIADAISFALSEGVKVVAAAGNDSGAVGWPAALPGVIAVSATDSRDNLAYFSSRGPEIDIAAPGVDILSTRMGGGVVSFSGTSMATPHVSGILALAIAAGTNLQSDDIGLPPDQQGVGRINALKTVSQ